MNEVLPTSGLTSEHGGEFAFLAGGGELGSLISAFDWSATALGPIDAWPQCLKTATAILLRSPVPIVMLWGEEGIMIYNDAYSAFAAGRHPRLLGSKVRQGWPEVADFNDNVMKVGLSGGTLAYRDQELTLYRSGMPEQVWLNLDYSPVLDESGKPAGVLAIVVETTKKVLAERRNVVERERLTQMFEQAPGLMAMLRGPDHVFELVNPAYMQLVGQRDVVGKPVREALPEIAGQGFLELLETVYTTGKAHVGSGTRVVLQRTPTGPAEERYVDFVFQPITDANGEVSGIFLEGSDVTERKRAEAWQAAQKRALELTVSDAPLAEVLHMLVRTAEMESTSGMVGSILLVDPDGKRLRHGAAPGLPETYTSAIDGLVIGPDTGSCGTAAHTKRPVYVSDIASDPLWTDFRELALAHDLHACWSTPILSTRGELLGTFAMYNRETREPTATDLELVDLATRTAALAIERKRAEDALRASEEFNRSILESSLDCIKVVSLDARLISINECGVRALEIEDSACATGESYLELWSGDDREAARAAIDKALAGGAGRFTGFYRTPSGRESWWDEVVTPIPGPGGRPERLLIVSRDVTERTRADAKIQQSEARLRALVNASSDVVYRMSPDWSEMRHLDGRAFVTDTRDPSTTWLAAYIHPDDQAMVMGRIREAIRAKGIFELEHRVRRRDGTFGWTFSRAVPLLDEQGEIAEWFGMASDVTARKEAQEHLQLLIDELNHRVKNTLFTVQSIVAQGLRGPHDREGLRNSIESRLVALSKSHDLLTRENWATADLRDVVGLALEPFGRDDRTAERFTVDGSDLRLRPKQALALGMAFHELATNAAKYGALSNGTGCVDVMWTAADGRLRIKWEERNGPPVVRPARKGFGSRLIERGLAHELDGTVRLAFARKGVICQIDMPTGDGHDGIAATG